MSSNFDWSQFEEVPDDKNGDTFDWSKFEEVKEGPSKTRSLLSAPVKGLIKGFSDIEKTQRSPFEPLAAAVRNIFGSKKGNFEEVEKEAVEKTLPTREGIPETLLEKAGELAPLAILGPESWLMKAAQVGGSALAGTAAKEAGLGEAGQSIGEAIGMGLPGIGKAILKYKSAPKAMQALYKEAEDLLPRGAETSSKSLVLPLSNILRDLRKGTSTPSKAAAIRTAEDLLQKGKGGKISVDELQAFKRDINELMKDPALLKRGQKFLPKIAELVDLSIDNYGKRFNPEWLEKYREANSMYSGIERSKYLQKFLGKYKKMVMNPLSWAALGVASPHKAATAYGVIKGSELMHRILFSPTLRRYYLKAAKAALEGNEKTAPVFLKKFDEAMTKEFGTDQGSNSSSSS